MTNLGKEDERTEFKKSTSELKEGVASIAAILNKHGSGTLYFGVKNNGDVCGQEVSDSTLREISQAIGNHIEPSVYPAITHETTPNGKSYVKVAFSGNAAPYSCAGKYRIRVADEDVVMRPDQLREEFREVEYVRTPDGTKLVFHRNEPFGRSFLVGETEDNVSSVGRKSVRNETSREDRILNMLRENPAITATQIAQECEVSGRTIERELKKLRENGIISHEGPTKTGKWVIIDDNNKDN